jgi:hypothetical protein
MAVERLISSDGEQAPPEQAPQQRSRAKKAKPQEQGRHV